MSLPAASATVARRRWPLWGAALAVLLAALPLMGGCLSSRPMKPGQMDQLWKLDPSLWDQAQRRSLMLGEKELPYRYQVTYDPSEVWATFRLYNTVRQSAQAHGTLNVALSERHARAVAGILRHMASQTARMTDAVVNDDNPRSEGQWAEAAGDLIGQIHRLATAANPQASAYRTLTTDDTAAWAMVPMLEIIALASYDVQTPPPASQIERLEQAEMLITRIIATIAFRLTGQTVSQQVVEELLRIQRSQPPPEAAAQTRELLLHYRRTTPHRYAALTATAAKAAAAARQMVEGMDYLADLSDQWPNVNYLAVEVRSYGRKKIFSLEYDIKPGRSVVLRHLAPLVPKVIFVGHGRIIIQNKLADSDSLAVLFESDNGEGVTLKFEGLFYGLVRLFAFPMDDVKLCEVRRRAIAEPNCQLHIYDIYMQALRGPAPQRLIHVETRSVPQFRPRQDLPPQLLGRSHMVDFNYYNGRRVWHYHSQQFRKPELWKSR